MNNEIIRIEHLKKSYATVTPLQDISTTINRGDVVSVIGPSGNGKSTLIRCVNLLEQPTSGKIFIDGEEITAPDADVTRIRKKMGMVFQSFNLFPHISVIENVMMAPGDHLGLSKQEAYDKAIELLDSVGMKEKAFVYPDELSGGQKQRVAIARALAMEPEILLMDEPTSALDPERVEEVKSVIYSLAKKGITMMIVTHEMNLARNVANRVFYLDEGGIYEEGTPEEIFDHPKKEKTKRFISQQHCCKFNVQSGEFDYYDAIGMVENLCRNNRISRSIQNKVSVVLEEIIVNMILAGLPKYPGIEPDYHFALECTADQQIILEITCPCSIDAVFREGDPLTLQLVNSMAKEIKITDENDVHRIVMTAF